MSLSGAQRVLAIYPRYCQVQSWNDNLGPNEEAQERPVAPTEPGTCQLRQIYHFLVPDPAYGVGVAQALGIDLVEFIPNGPHNSKP